MHPETSEPPVNSAAEPSLEESAGDHGDAGPGVRKEGAITPGSQGARARVPHTCLFTQLGTTSTLTHTHPYSYKNS